MTINGVPITLFDQVIIVLLVLLIIGVTCVGLYRLLVMGTNQEHRNEQDAVRGQRLPPEYDVENTNDKFPRPSGRGWPISKDISTDEDEDDSRD